MAVVLDDRSESVALLNALAAREVLFDVVYERDLSSEKLAPYRAVALLTTQTVHERALSMLENYVASGGRLFAAGDVAAYDEAGRKRSRPAWLGRGEGKGESTYYDQVPPLDELAKTLVEAGGAGTVQVETPSGVCYNLVQQPAMGRTLVHLLNYTSTPAGGVRLTLHGKFHSISLVSPDGPEKVQLKVPSGASGELEVPAVKVYSVVILEGAGASPVRAARRGAPPKRGSGN